jgi:hypothetical protein
MNRAALTIPLDNDIALHMEGTAHGLTFAVALREGAGTLVLVAHPRAFGFVRTLPNGGRWGIVTPHNGQAIFFCGTKNHQFALWTDANGQLRAAALRDGEVVWNSQNRPPALVA